MCKKITQQIILIYAVILLSGCAKQTPESNLANVRSEYIDEKGNAIIPKKTSYDLALEKLKSGDIPYEYDPNESIYQSYDLGYLTHPFLDSSFITYNGQRVTSRNFLDIIFIKKLAKKYFVGKYKGSIFVRPELTVDANVDQSGNLYFTAGLLKEVKSVDVLLGIAFHELGHLVLNHHAYRNFANWFYYNNKFDDTYSGSSSTNTVALVGVATVALYAFPAIFIAQAAGYNPNDDMQKEAIRNEQDADVFAIETMIETGLNPDAYIDFISSLPTDKNHLNASDRQLYLKNYMLKKHEGFEKETHFLEYDESYSRKLKIIEDNINNFKKILEHKFDKKNNGPLYAATQEINEIGIDGLPVVVSSQYSSFTQDVSLLKKSIIKNGKFYLPSLFLSLDYYYQAQEYGKDTIGRVVYNTMAYESFADAVFGLDYGKVSKRYNFKNAVCLGSQISDFWKSASPSKKAAVQSEYRKINGRLFLEDKYLSDDFISGIRSAAISYNIKKGSNLDQKCEPFK
jgi:hypothetical protein